MIYTKIFDRNMNSYLVNQHIAIYNYTLQQIPQESWCTKELSMSDNGKSDLSSSFTSTFETLVFNITTKTSHDEDICLAETHFKFKFKFNIHVVFRCIQNRYA